MIILFNRHGANVDRKNKYGETPLHVACFFGDERIVEMLLKYGSNVDEQNNNGFTPLHKATYNGHEKVIQLLLDYHANRYIRNHGSFNPREIAFNRGNKGYFPKAKNKFINFFGFFYTFKVKRRSSICSADQHLKKVWKLLEITNIVRKNIYLLISNMTFLPYSGQMGKLIAYVCTHF